jgi:hypothetical protein
MEKILCEGHDVLFTGEEDYPIIGDLFSKEDCEWAFTIFAIKKYKRYWNCLEKAKIIADYLGKKEIVLGELVVWSKDWKTAYGFKFNPPYEFHAWVQYEENIIDLALPGVIELGSLMEDEHGPYLIGRKPIILASKMVPEWIKYTKWSKYPI